MSNRVTIVQDTDGFLRAYDEQGKVVGTESLAEARQSDTFNYATGLTLLALAAAQKPQEAA